MTISDTQEGSSYLLDLTSMRIAQLNDESLMSKVGNCLASCEQNNTIYTYKCVEGVEFIHKNNRTLVPKLKQQSVLEWYHNI